MNINRSLVVILLSLLLAQGISSASESPGADAPTARSDAIINGSVASVSTYPFITFLADAFGEQYCGASLISETWVLTAAHCFVNGAGDEIDLETGVQSSVVLNSDTVTPLAQDAEEGQIGQIVIHPSYNPDFETSDNADDFDIALVELTAAVSFEPVKLLSASATEPASGTEALIMGWGTTDVDTDNNAIDPSNELLVASQQIVAREACEQLYESGITDNMLCAGAVDSDSNTDTCQGDSGGPLVVASGNDFVQIGIVSFGGTETGPPCGDPDVPGVYSSVSALADFISEHVSDAQFVTLEASDSGASVVEVQVNGNSVTISWTAVSGATGYRLYYAPSPAQTPIESIDMGSALSINGDLPSGSAFFVAIEAYNEAGSLPEISNVEEFTIE